jgi:histidinol dehydrogenase
VKEICMVTPPGKDGKVPPNILAAAKVCGVDRVFRVGGAQAVAALAYGTETVPRVDKIVGPGNRYVAEAKKQVFGRVGIDMVAGPSEILVIADEKCDPRIVAADLLSQAEHDKNASAVLITDSQKLAEGVRDAIEEQLSQLKREEIARASIENNGKIIVAGDLAAGIDIANEIAPEHLELCVDEPFAWLDKIKNAGSIFMGRSCPEALGDYFAGPNHTLPTSGTARFSSPLSVDDFVKKSQYTYYTPQALGRARETVSHFAKKEGLTGHARSVDIRFDPAVVGEDGK